MPNSVGGQFEIGDREKVQEQRERERLTLTVTPEQKHDIARAAKRSGLSTAAYVRMVTLNQVMMDWKLTPHPDAQEAVESAPFSTFGG